MVSRPAGLFGVLLQFVQEAADVAFEEAPEAPQAAEPEGGKQGGALAVGVSEHAMRLHAEPGGDLFDGENGILRQFC